VFDEAHNLFKSVLTMSKRGKKLYEVIMDENDA